MDRRPLHLILVGSPPLLAAMAAMAVRRGGAGLPIENAYLFARYAQNLAAGAGYSFNPHEPSYGATSLVWTLLNAALIRISGLDYVTVAQALGIMALAVVVLTAQAWVRRETGSRFWSVLAGCACGIIPLGYMNAVSGMDSMFFAMALLGGLYIYRFTGLSRPVGLGALAAVVFHTRAEGLYLAVAVIALELWRITAWREKREARRLAVFVLAFLMVSALFELYMELDGPGWLPAVYLDKTMVTPGCRPEGWRADLLALVSWMIKGQGRAVEAQGFLGGAAWGMALAASIQVLTMILRRGRAAAPPRRLVLTLAVLAGILGQVWSRAGGQTIKGGLGLALTAGAVALLAGGLFRTRQAGPEPQAQTSWRALAGSATLAGLLLLPASYALGSRMGPLFGGYYNRYLVVMLPAIYILAARALDGMQLSQNRTAKAVALVLGLAALVMVSRHWRGDRELWLRETSINEGIRTRTAQWLRDHTPEDAVVLTGHVGVAVVGGRSGRYALDLGGLVNHDIYPYYNRASCNPGRRWQRTLQYLKDRRVDYYVTFAVTSDDPSLDPSHEPGFSLAGEVRDEQQPPPYNVMRIWKLDLTDTSPPDRR